MGDVNNNNAIRPTQGGQAAPAAPAERSRPQGRLSAEGSGEGRAVVVQQVPTSPFGTRVPPVPLPRGLDLTKMREFLAKYPHAGEIRGGLPGAERHRPAENRRHHGVHSSTSSCAASAWARRSSYETLIVEYGLKELIVAIRELRSRRKEGRRKDPPGTCRTCRATNSPSGPGRTISIRTISRAIRRRRTSRARSWRSATPASPDTSPRSSGPMRSFEKELTSRTLSFVARLPQRNGFFKVNDTRARYFTDLFKAEFARRFLQELSSKLFIDKPTKSKLDEMTKSIGDELFAEIFLSQMRMEAAAPEFKLETGLQPPHDQGPQDALRNGRRRKGQGRGGAGSERLLAPLPAAVRPGPPKQFAHGGAGLCPAEARADPRGGPLRVPRRSCSRLPSSPSSRTWSITSSSPTDRPWRPPALS